MASNEEQEARVTKRILRFLRDWYNQDVKRPVPLDSIAGNIGADISSVANSLKQMSKKGFVSSFKDLGGHPQCRILVSGLEHLEAIENKQSPVQTSSLKTDVNYMIEKFNQCKKDLEKLRNDENSEIVKILTERSGKPDEMRLMEISKRMRNLLKIGFVDGTERSVAFTKEGGNFYTSLQREDYFGISKSERQRRIYFQHIRWHEIKANEFLDELKLIKEVNQVPKKTIENKQDEQKSDEPKEMLKFYHSELTRFFKNHDYDSIIVTVDRLYVYLNKIQLSKADRYHLTRSLEYLSNQSHSQAMHQVISKKTPDVFEEEQYQKYIVPAFNSVNAHLDSIIRTPQEIKILLNPVKRKEGFLSNLKNKISFKKYLEIKNSPDVFYENLILEINKAYDNDMSLTVLILLRKLFETGIIDIIWKKYKSDEIYRTKKGGFKQFGTILDEVKTKTIGGDFGHFKDDVLEVIGFADTIREKGNESAHRLTFDISIDEIEKMKNQVKRSTEILFRVMANV